MLKIKKFKSNAKKTDLKKIIIYIFLTAIVLSIIGFITGFLLLNNFKKSENVENEIITENVESEEMINVYKAKVEIKGGTDFSEQDFVKIIVPKNDVPGNVIQDINEIDNINNKKIRFDIKPDDYLTLDKLIDTTLWHKADERFSEFIFSEGSIPTTYPEELVGKYVDIKLIKINAKDEVVVSKTLVVSAGETRLGFYLNNNEQELMEEALAEGILKIRVYLDDMQEASAVTFSGKNTYK